MDNLNAIIASNLKNYRNEKKISLDKMAEITGVSKSMIGQIERGVSTPTISTMMKLAGGLKLPLNYLLTPPQSDFTLIRKGDLTNQVPDDNLLSIHTYFPYSDGRTFEILVIEIEKGGQYQLDPHPSGTEKYLTVFKGRLNIRLDDQEHLLESGDAMRYKADKPQTYFNIGNKAVKLQMVIQHPLP